MTILANRLKEARKKSGYNQIDAAKKLGISNGTLSGYERNYRDPDTDILKKMADLYEVSVDWLLGHEVKDIDSMTEDEIDEEIKEIMKEVNVWYKNAPEDKREKLEMLRKIIKTFTEDD